MFVFQDVDEYPKLKPLLKKKHEVYHSQKMCTLSEHKFTMALSDVKEQLEKGFLGQLLAKGKMSCYPHKEDGTTRVKMEIDIGTGIQSLLLA